MKILLICTHNACRSIIGEAVVNKIGASALEAKSAGSSPRGVIHPLTIKHLNLHGYDTSTLKSQSWDGFEDWKPDVIITLCDQAAGETCPAYLGNSVKVHWGLPDPSKGAGDEESEVKKFNRTINTLETRVKKLLNENLDNLGKSELNALFEKVI